MSTKKVILTKENQDFGFAIHHFTTETLLKQILIFLFIILIYNFFRSWTEGNPRWHHHIIFLGLLNHKAFEKKQKAYNSSPFHEKFSKLWKHLWSLTVLEICYGMYTFNKEYQAVIEVSGEYRLKNFCLGSFHKKYGI